MLHSCYRSYLSAEVVSLSLPLFVITKKRTIKRGGVKTKHRNRTQGKQTAEHKLNMLQNTTNMACREWYNNHSPEGPLSNVREMEPMKEKKKKITENKRKFVETDFWGRLRGLEGKGFWRERAFHASAP